jgi:pimeloyl-ACP methyl ester carboxylesterase
LTICPQTQLAYDRAGQGETVVLIHAGVADRRMWDQHWDALTQTHDVVRVDLRGFGESTVHEPQGWTAYDDVARTLAALGIRRAHLVGCSFGAGVAAELALAEPELAASLLLVSPGGVLFTERTPELTAFVEAEDAALEAGDLLAAAEADVRWWVDSPRRGPDEVPAAVRDAVRAMQLRVFEIGEDWEDLEGQLEPEAPERYAEITAPTCVLVGGLDLDVVQRTADEIMAGVPGARRVDWPDAAHLLPMECPEDFVELLRTWVAG